MARNLNNYFDDLIQKRIDKTWQYILRIAFNGTSYYVVGDDGKMAVIGSLQDCKNYIDNQKN